MASSRRNTSQRLTLVILLLISITVVTLDYHGTARSAITSLRNTAGDVLSPIQRVVAAGLHPVGNVVSGAFNYGGAESENEQLQAEIGRLRQQLYESQDAASQLEALLREQHLPFVGSIPVVTGEVISAPSSNFELTIEIDRGTANGVGVGMPVVSGAGLAGVIVSAGSDTAEVQLVTDPRSQVGVRFPDGTVAVASGQGADNPLSAPFLSTTSGPRAGELAYTSGLEGAAFPSGLPVGTVASVRHSGGAVTSQAEITPIVNFDNLQYVAVLQWFPPA